MEGRGFLTEGTWPKCDGEGEKQFYSHPSLISLPPSLCNRYLRFSLDLIYRGFSHSSRKTAGRGFLCKAFGFAGILFSGVAPGWFLQGGSQLGKA